MASLRLSEVEGKRVGLERSAGSAEACDDVRFGE